MHPATILFAFAAVAVGAVAGQQEYYEEPQTQAIHHGHHHGAIKYLPRPTPSPQELNAERQRHLSAYDQVLQDHLAAVAAATELERNNPYGGEDLTGYHVVGKKGRTQYLDVPRAPYKAVYSVADGKTGDKKSVTELHEGDVTKGSYSVVHADGILRTVNWVVTPTGGFKAQVLEDGVPVVVGADAGYGAQGHHQAPAHHGQAHHGHHGYQHQAHHGHHGGHRPGKRPRANAAAAAAAAAAQAAPAPAPQPQQQQHQAHDNQHARYQPYKDIAADYEREREEHLSEHARVTQERLGALAEAHARIAKAKARYVSHPIEQPIAVDNSIQ